MNKAEEIKKLCQNVANLLEHPEPGLYTWTDMLIRESEQLYAALGEVLHKNEARSERAVGSLR